MNWKSRRSRVSQRRRFWVPLLYAAAAFGVGVALPRLECSLFPGMTVGVAPEAALAILSSIASGMMGLTAIVFSIASVMVQFSATAYSPRLVLWLARSAMITHAIGLFTGTFVYALVALAWINRDGSGLIPPATVWFAVCLLLASLVLFVLLVERAGMLQVTRGLAFAGDEGRRVIERMYGAPRQPGHGSGSGAAESREAGITALPPGQTLAHHAWNDLVVLALDEIRYCGATSIQVMRRTQALLQELIGLVLPDRRASLAYYLVRVEKGIRRGFADDDDQRDALAHDRQGLGLARERKNPAPGTGA